VYVTSLKFSSPGSGRDNIKFGSFDPKTHSISTVLYSLEKSRKLLQASLNRVYILFANQMHLYKK
jgi:hypothetical protein